MTMRIKVFNSVNTSGTANLLTNYAHKEIGLTGSITASFGASEGMPEVGFSGGIGVIFEQCVPGYSYFNY